MNRQLRKAAATLALWSIALAAQAATPAVEIAQEPLYSGRANVHPNLLLSLSVEFPTVGVAYRGDGGKYNRTREYVGYFNPAKCYVYHGGNRNLGEDAWFRIHNDADALHECDGHSFSGNFMNWAASSAIDMLRYALTGGDRVVDTPQLTVLQRAVLRNASSSNFYAHATYFPRRAVKAEGDTSAPRKVTPFDVSTLYVVSCRNRILFSDISSGVTGNSNSALASSYCNASWDGSGTPPDEARDKKLGEYLVRVRVCDGDEGAARTDLCKKYGAHYKPVGELQRNAERVRVGAMGYLLDDAAARYGGVLRAPLKYLGSTRYTAPAFVREANDRLEWDPQTGVFYSNPEDPAARNSTGTNSGVINYLNKFGRNASYKTFDPVGELYYEGLRYLQGKQPTPDATSGMAETMRDGFPVYEDWTDPVIASCQRNTILSIADVNTHWDRYIPGNQRTTYGSNQAANDSARAVEAAVTGKTPALDVRTWTRTVGEMEADAGGTYGNPAPRPALAGLENIDTGSASHGTYYMAGLAYWANTNNIRLDKPVRVQTYTIDVDEGGNGLVDGNTRGIKPRDSQLYLAAKYGGFRDRNGDGNPFKTSGPDGQPLADAHVEWDNGDGVPANYFLAGQPLEMIAAIRRVFASIAASSGTLSGVALSTGRIDTDGLYIYQPGFDPVRWNGSLRKLKLRLREDGKVIIAETPVWEAGKVLSGAGANAPVPLPANRRIYTAAVASGVLENSSLVWDALTEAQRDALDLSPQGGEPDGLGRDRLDYLRGVRDRELGRPNGVFRQRDGVLGDIVNSNPVHVGPPSRNLNGPGYANFVTTHDNRAPTVYVGANDGMLHAFRASDGRELFAYVPAAVLPRLPALTDPNYAHRPYVDGGIAVAEARIGTTWKTVLASGMGGGAQGLFALDVSDPERFADGGRALFEFTDEDDPDMGNLIGAPAIAKLRAGIKNGATVYRYFVVAASGLNNYTNDGSGRYNGDAASALFLLALDKAADQAWQEGVNYYKFRLPAASALQASGLAQPALVAGSDGAVHTIYAGDLQGQLWRITLDGAFAGTGAPGKARRIFAAERSGTRQPITSQPRVVFAPGGGYMVLVGTGKFVEPADAAKGNFAVQSFYAVFDPLHAGYSASRADLVPRALTAVEEGGYQVSGDAFTYGIGSAARKGWYIDFPNSGESGERVVTNAVVLNGLVFFNTVIPGSDPCAAGGGRSYVLRILEGMPLAGHRTGYLSQVGMLSAPVVLETGVTRSGRDAVGARTVERRHQVVNFGTGGAEGQGAASEQESGAALLRAGRMSWREVLNWQELRNAASKK